VTGAEHADQSDTQHPEANASTGQAPVTRNRPGRCQFVAAHWREIVSLVLELAGIGVLSAGFWLIRPWYGLIVLGVGLIVIGFASSPRFDKPKQLR
jgi:hypothetical protein